MSGRIQWKYDGQEWVGSVQEKPVAVLTFMGGLVQREDAWRVVVGHNPGKVGEVSTGNAGDLKAAKELAEVLLGTKGLS